MLNKSFNIFRFIFTLSVLILFYSLPSQTWGYELTILHTNDIHAFLGGYNEKTEIPCFTSKEPNCVGGFAKIAQSIITIRQKKPNVLLLDAGDTSLGTAFYSDYLKIPEKMPIIEFMNRLQYDAMCPGNHEFDYGCGVFFGFIKKLKFPIIASNLTFTNAEMQSYIKPWVIIEKGGKRIGIIGLTLKNTATTSKPCSEAIFSDEAQSIRNAITEIKKHNVYTIIILSHAGIHSDLKYASEIDDISVIVGGHTHTLLSNTLPNPFGPYPIVKKSPSGKPVLIVTAKEKGAFLGYINITFDERGVPQKWHGDALYLNKPISDTPDVTPIADLLDYYGAPIYKRLNEKVGETCDPNSGSTNTKSQNGSLDGDEPSYYCRRYETLSADLILNAVMEKGHEEEADIILVATGNIRASLPVGTVTRLNTSTVLPMPEEQLLIGEVSGKTLKEVFENSVSGTDRPNIFLGKFLQIAGAKLVYNSDKPIGSRVQSIEILNKKGTFDPLNLDRMYKVIITSYVGKGNDGYTMLKEVQWKSLNTNIEDLLITYLKKHSPVCVKKDGRIVNLGKKPE